MLTNIAETLSSLFSLLLFSAERGPEGENIANLAELLASAHQADGNRSYLLDVLTEMLVADLRDFDQGLDCFFLHFIVVHLCSSEHSFHYEVSLLFVLEIVGC